MSKIFDLNIETVGVINKSTPGFSPEDMHGFPSHAGSRDLVVMMDDGRVYLSTNVITYLCGTTMGYSYKTIGRTHLYRWTSETSSDALRHALYPSRNDREAWVSKRNLSIIEWIERLGKDPNDDLAMYKGLPEGRVPADYAFDPARGLLIDRITGKPVNYSFQPLEG